MMNILGNSLCVYKAINVQEFLNIRITFKCEMDPSWRHPFSSIVSGPSGCGKTLFTLKFREHLEHMVVPQIEKVMWCFGIYQDIFDRYLKIQFQEGLLYLNVFDGEEWTLLVLDDLLSETDEKVTKIFTKISHHRNVYVLYLT